MSNLEAALSIAIQAHRGGLDKANAIYILHPLRVMSRMETVELKTVAILHDVIEDTKWSLKELRDAGFAEAILVALDHLTRRCEENYETYIARVKENDWAKEVKIADLEDNMDIRRLDCLSSGHIMRLKKYHKAWLALRDSDIT